MLFELKPEGVNTLIRSRARQAEADARHAEADANTAITEAHQVVAQWEAHCAKLKVRIAELETALAVKTAHAEGLDAVAVAYREQHPDTPLRADSGRRYRDGEVKRRIRLIYEAAFDATIRKLLPRIDPVTCRAD